MIQRFFIVLLLSFAFLLPAHGQDKSKSLKSKGINKENFLYLDTKYGRTIIQLYPKKAPKHVERIRKLARENFYDGIKFHRVIHNFMAQTGDPTGTGTGGSDYPDLRAEFSDIPFNRGTIGAARTQNPHSANSQFFICFQAAPHLNGQYTVWGKVVHGMEFIDQIKRGVGRGGTVADPDEIVALRVAADVKDKPPVPLEQFVPGYEKQQRKKILPTFE